MATFTTKPKANQQQKENDFRGKPVKAKAAARLPKAETGKETMKVVEKPGRKERYNTVFVRKQSDIAQATKNWSYRHSFTIQTVDSTSTKRSVTIQRPLKDENIETQTEQNRTKSRNGQPTKPERRQPKEKSKKWFLKKDRQPKAGGCEVKNTSEKEQAAKATMQKSNRTIR
jgi:hypothetical protein